MSRIITFITLAFLTTLTFAQEQAKTAELSIMPEWHLYNEAGQLVKSSDLLGKPLVIHFWATWCPYCKKLQPGLDRLNRKYQAEGLQMIAVSIREDEGARPQKELDSRGMSFKTLINGDDMARNLFNVSGTPTTVFINKAGHIVSRTSISDPEDPRLEKIVKYIVNQ
ncbi:TlpA disulfide reductase family protein [uncultured Paraglaciecola sp.]|mgnify:CR=1 FL=1|uniref:TlpA family protein disulfide reductase n=1 Tax=uncultured Paraglaciecola sp. TaxID=1765024 RepID=UPI0030DC837A|tara:strand:+ start:99822 stop:100322 length:501 start_codon:yes stop_codon:yes gene_type:complete